MGTSTSIEWTNATWNPIRGCSRVSEGCRNCYAERQAVRGIHGAYEGLIKTVAVTKDGGGKLPVVLSEPRWTGEVRFIEEHLEDPLKWRKSRRIFVNSMSDLFHEKVQDEWIDRIFAVMYAAHWHRFQVLTKRPERMREYCLSARIDSIACEALEQYRQYGRFAKDESLLTAKDIADDIQWPLPNVWLGVSAEDRRTFIDRWHFLKRTPAAVRWISYEPALESLGDDDFSGSGIDWIVVGGESGPSARPFNIEWARDVIAQCKAAGVACFVKQITERGRKIPYEQFPDDLQVREYPDAVQRY